MCKVLLPIAKVGCYCRRVSELRLRSMKLAIGKKRGSNETNATNLQNERTSDDETKQIKVCNLFVM